MGEVERDEPRGAEPAGNRPQPSPTRRSVLVGNEGTPAPARARRPRTIQPGASPVNGQPPPLNTRWKKGQSGNPGGRPKGESITALLRRVLEREHNGKKLMEVLAERLVSEAMKGKFPFAKELLDRVEGKVQDKLEVNGPMTVRVVYDDEHTK